MSTSPNEQESAHLDSESGIEAAANQLVALLEEFEAKIRQGSVPAEFAQRLARLRQTVEELTVA